MQHTSSPIDLNLKSGDEINKSPVNKEHIKRVSSDLPAQDRVLHILSNKIIIARR